MSLPTEFDFAVLKRGDGATTEVFTIICGLTDVNVNRVVQSNDRFVRDCAKPGEVPFRKTRTTGRQLDITGSGMTDKASVDILEDALGKVGNYRVEMYADDGTDVGDLLGTFAAPFLLTAANLSVPRTGDATAEITLASHGAWTWTPAP